MRDLATRRHAYLVRGSALHPKPVHQAHRAVRNAAALGALFGVGGIEIFDALERIDEALFQYEVACEDLDRDAQRAVPLAVIERADVTILAEVVRRVRDTLREGIDEQLQPRGPIGERIVRDIERNGDEAIFEWTGDGGLSQGRGWLSINDLRMVLDDLVVALGEAVRRGLEVALLPDRGWPVGYYGDTPEERRNVPDVASRRQAYLVCDSALSPGPLASAHRGIRNAAAVSAVLGQYSIELDQVLERIDAALNEPGPPPVIAPGDVPVLLEAARLVRDRLRDGLDDQRIADNVEHGGDDAVFERRRDGTLGLTKGRMSIDDLSRLLDELIPALEEAVTRGLDVVLLPPEEGR